MGSDCQECGAPACQQKHDCAGCSGEAVKQCDRGHSTCDGCAWFVGEGPDTVERCVGGDEQDQERESDDAEVAHV